MSQAQLKSNTHHVAISHKLVTLALTSQWLRATPAGPQILSPHPTLWIGEEKNSLQQGSYFNFYRRPSNLPLKPSFLRGVKGAPTFLFWRFLLARRLFHRRPLDLPCRPPPFGSSSPLAAYFHPDLTSTWQPAPTQSVFFRRPSWLPPDGSSARSSLLRQGADPRNPILVASQRIVVPCPLIHRDGPPSSTPPSVAPLFSRTPLPRSTFLAALLSYCQYMAEFLNEEEDKKEDDG